MRGFRAKITESAAAAELLRKQPRGSRERVAAMQQLPVHPQARHKYGMTVLAGTPFGVHDVIWCNNPIFHVSYSIYGSFSVLNYHLHTPRALFSAGCARTRGEQMGINPRSPS